MTTPDQTTPEAVETPAAPVLDGTNSAEFGGRRWLLAENLPLVPLMRFAHAQQTPDVSELVFVGHLWALLTKLVTRDQIDTFAAVAEDLNPTIDELMTFMNEAIGVMSARPTSRSSASPDGPQLTKPNSKGASTSRASSIPAPIEGSGLSKDPRILELVQRAG